MIVIYLCLSEIDDHRLYFGIHDHVVKKTKKMRDDKEERNSERRKEEIVKKGNMKKMCMNSRMIILKNSKLTKAKI